jgi:hypothetical protein
MARTRVRTSALALAVTPIIVASLIATAPAMAAEKVFTASQVLAHEAYHVDVSMGLAGDAVVAWRGAAWIVACSSPVAALST